MNNDETIEVPKKMIANWHLTFVMLWECNNGCRLCPSGSSQVKEGVKETAKYLNTSVNFLEEDQDNE